MKTTVKILLAFVALMLSGYLCELGYGDPSNPRWLGMLEFFGGILLGMAIIGYVLVKFVDAVRRL
ncbi:hypothetical protein HH214_13245 [Mucilaginibacter robiniae]|uniref:Uncharacterized protein n=1 Tax=Mucilaginibacter robiniae TaxID=2728022 RepID=A0A7L5E4U5_9SPHI|nr:hypothetical protein [Mucilaginibacter robiniae]QJD96764.1 hypothetical protein HH214_13245 [Mucilaginibacter robiniae]